jgi:tRNA U34 5-methylaminomethyl-2-thiouridine-forming methyltransferase MnmC
MQRIIVETADGSSSVYVPELDESYHSKFGSIQESRHVFIQSGLEYSIRNGNRPISILEIGFGTGLNAFLSCLFAAENVIPVNYFAIEPDPIGPEVYENLNYPARLQADERRDEFIRMHAAPWVQNTFSTPYFSLHKFQISLDDLKLSHQINLVYFDAFAPRVQPELWTPEVFIKMYELLEPGGVLVTYCAKGEVKRNIKSAGFTVEALPGPKGKREMTRAIK